MIRKFLSLALLLFIFTLPAQEACAEMPGFIGPPVFDENTGGTAMNSLVAGIVGMAKTINKASAEMMKIGDMLICNSLRGEAADVKIEIFDINITKLKLVALDIFISGCVLYVLGFFITVIASFYMFDVAFNLSLAIVLLPIALALWPFGWTREYLGKVVESIAYYTGIFIFLPLGILIAKALVVQIIGDAFGSSADFMQAFEEDKSDLIRDKLGVFQLPFLKVLVSYIVAIRLIPLMANEFCEHFFGGSLLGSPMSEKMSQAAAILKQKTVGKVGKFAGDVAKHQVGKTIENMADKHGGFMNRTMARYGKQMAKTKK